jgi:hypothetical protein
MGKDDLFKSRKAGRRERKGMVKALKSRQWLIVCEGAKTEPNYFNGLVRYLYEQGGKDISDDVTTIGLGKNTKSLVKSVTNFFERVDTEYGSMLIPYGNVAVVFDRDAFGKDAFNQAIQMANRQSKDYCDIEKYYVAWSNESFETWIYLHFNYYESALDRHVVNDKLTDIFRSSGILTKKQSYDGDLKADKRLFEYIIKAGGKVQTAIANAERLDKKYNDSKKYADQNPRTCVHELVKALISESKIPR